VINSDAIARYEDLACFPCTVSAPYDIGRASDPGVARPLVVGKFRDAYDFLRNGRKLITGYQFVYCVC